MASDPRDYKLELSGPAGGAGGDAPAVPAASPGVSAPEAPAARPFLSVHFACCGVYQRIYLAADAGHYEGRCPRCGRAVRFVVGEGGSSARSFVAR